MIVDDSLRPTHDAFELDVGITYYCGLGPLPDRHIEGRVWDPLRAAAWEFVGWGAHNPCRTASSFIFPRPTAGPRRENLVQAV